MCEKQTVFFCKKIMELEIPSLNPHALEFSPEFQCLGKLYSYNPDGLVCVIVALSHNSQHLEGRGQEDGEFSVSLNHFVSS